MSGVVAKRVSRAAPPGRAKRGSPRGRARESVRRAREETYRRILFDAAERVFADHGFEATRVQDIARDAGLSVGTLYGLFPGKAELFQAIHEQRLGDILERARRDASSSRSILETLLDGMAGYLEYLMAHPNYLRMHLRDGGSWALGPTYAAGGQAEAWRDGLELMGALFRQGIDEGVLIQEDPALLAKLTTAMHQVLLADWVESGMKVAPARVVARTQELFRQAFCRRGE